MSKKITRKKLRKFCQKERDRREAIAKANKKPYVRPCYDAGYANAMRIVAYCAGKEGYGSKKKIIEICERERKRGEATAYKSKFDEGYATGMKLGGELANKLPKDKKGMEDGSPKVLKIMSKANKKRISKLEKQRKKESVGREKKFMKTLPKKPSQKTKKN